MDGDGFLSARAGSCMATPLARGNDQLQSNGRRVSFVFAYLPVSALPFGLINVPLLILPWDVSNLPGLVERHGCLPELSSRGGNPVPRVEQDGEDGRDGPH